jgi:Tol biopolymer transport system component
VDWNPVWGPGGAYLYFCSDRGGRMNLWRVPIDEATGQTRGEPEPVTTGGAGIHQHLRISSEGTRIAYVELTQQENIYRITFDPVAREVRGDPVPVTRGALRWNSPDLSPDGAWLVFTSAGDQEDVFVSRADGTARRRLTDDVHKDRGPRWSPDGSRIVFYSDRSGSYEFWEIHQDGSGLRQLTDAPDHALVNPVWSPDGSRIVYLDNFGREAGIFEAGRVWSEQFLQPLWDGGERGEEFWPWSWSSDGHWIAGSLRSPGTMVGGLALISPDSGQLRRLIDFGVWPRWIGDSSFLLFGWESRMYLLDVETLEHRELLSVEPPAEIQPYEHSVSADGRTIYFTQSVSEADVWLLDLE